MSSSKFPSDLENGGAIAVPNKKPNEDSELSPLQPMKTGSQEAFYGSVPKPTHSRRPSNSIFNSDSALPQNSSHFYQRLQQRRSISQSPRETLSRVENLQEMRPFRLIGVSVPPCNWEEKRKSDEWVAGLKNRKLQEYYVKQNDLIDRYEEIDRMLDSGIQFSMLREYGNDIGPDQVTIPTLKRQGAPANIDGDNQLISGPSKAEQSAVVMVAIYVNMAVNVLLLIAKIIVTLLTNSLSVLASLIDSVLDFMSTAIIWFSTRLVSHRDWKTKHLYPVGRSRLEPIGVLVFSVLIIVAFLQVGNEALQRILFGEHLSIVVGIASSVIMAFTVIIKLFCWIWCKNIDSSAVQALAQDAMTDVVFNFFSIVFPLVGHFFDIWWLDPAGALFLSCYIIYSWGETALEHIEHLTGTTASAEDRQVLLYSCSRFAESILQITALNAYHTGDRLTVEVDIVLDVKSSLRDAHDIGEALQYALETLPFVERAFVHLDYRTGNFEGHLPN